MKLTDIIRRPLITEKTTLLREAGRTVVFEVDRGRSAVVFAHPMDLPDPMPYVGTYNCCGQVGRVASSCRRSHAGRWLPQ